MIRASSVKQLPRFGIRRIAVACGVFDGLHRGHAKIIDTLRECARDTDAATVVITFEPHPKSVLRPSEQPQRLLSQRHKFHLLEQARIDAVVIIPFTPALAQLRPDEFIDRLLSGNDLEITAFCVGESWRFGHKAQGDTTTLKGLGEQYNFAVVPVPPVLVDGQPVSSTRVREALRAGDMDRVRELLGRNFSIMESVKFGKGIATSDLNCPTANIACGNEAYPRSGVYAARVRIHRSDKGMESYGGVLYIGDSPTFVQSPSAAPNVEIHIFDFNREIYGEMVEVELIEFLREDRKFASVELLKEQIAEDVETARKLVGQN